MIEPYQFLGVLKSKDTEELDSGTSSNEEGGFPHTSSPDTCWVSYN